MKKNWIELTCFTTESTQSTSPVIEENSVSRNRWNRWNWEMVILGNGNYSEFDVEGKNTPKHYPFAKCFDL